MAAENEFWRQNEAARAPVQMEVVSPNLCMGKCSPLRGGGYNSFDGGGGCSYITIRHRWWYIL